MPPEMFEAPEPALAPELFAVRFSRPGVYSAAPVRKLLPGDCMNGKKKYGAAIAGALAGAVNGLFGAGGGMVLVPALTSLTELPEDAVFPSSVSIILPICVVSLAVSSQTSGLPLQTAWPYLLGSIPGGLLAGLLDGKLPVKWLHRVLGGMILWGGMRYLC